MTTLPTLTFNQQWDVQRNAMLLSKTLRAERSANALSGYWFQYSNQEHSEHKRAGELFFWHCQCMVTAARDMRASMELYRNMNGQMAVRLGAPGSGFRKPAAD